MAEETGLVHARLFDGHGAARTLHLPELASWTPNDGVLGAHFDNTKAAARDWLRRTSGLDPLVAEALITEETRPRAVSIGDGLPLALRGVNLNPGAEPDDMVSIRLWRHASRVVSSGKRDLLSVRDLLDRLIRHVEDLDAVRDRAAVAHEELLSRISEQLNARMYVLCIVAALFLPFGFLTGMLGINVGGIPGADNPWGFLTFAGILVLIVVAQVVLFRRKGWL